MEDQNAIRALQALAHVHRLAIFRLLVRRGPSGLPAGEIARTIGISPTASSFHFKELDHAGLIHASRDGRYVRYAVRVETTRALLAFLTEDCCEGRPELCGQDFYGATDVCQTPARTASKKSMKI